MLTSSIILPSTNPKVIRKQKVIKKQICSRDLGFASRYFNQVRNFQETIQYYEKLNLDLKRQIKQISSHNSIFDFQRDLSNCAVQIDQRNDLLQKAVNEVKRFRLSTEIPKKPTSPDQKIPDPKLEYLQTSTYHIPKKRFLVSPEALRHSPRIKRVFPPSSPIFQERNSFVRSELWNKNQALIEKAMEQERLLLVLKMRLRLCHDIRDLNQLRLILSKISSGEKISDINPLETSQNEKESYKEPINRLKTQINREYSRIQMIKQLIFSLNYYATKIQSAWRGFQFRKRSSSSLSLHSNQKPLEPSKSLTPKKSPRQFCSKWNSQNSN